MYFAVITRMVNVEHYYMNLATGIFYAFTPYGVKAMNASTPINL